MKPLSTFLILGVTLALILVLWTPAPAECQGTEAPASPFNPLAFAPNKDNGMSGFGKSLKEMNDKNKKDKKKKKKKKEDEKEDDDDDSDDDE